MSLTQVQVISNALTILGQKPITSLSGNISDIVNAALQAYNFLLTSKLSKGQWRFAVKIVELSQLNETPPPQSNWAYIYQLPGDFLKLIHLDPQNYAFELYAGNLLYSNLNSPLYLEYVFLPSQTAFPDYFNEYLIYEIACYLALASAQSPQYYAPLRAERDYQMALAMAADAQNRPQTPIMSRPIISNRFVATWTDG